MKDLPVLSSDDEVYAARRLLVITRRDGIVYRITDNDEALVGDFTFSPLAGLDIAAVRHTANGETPSMEISFSHYDGATIDTADLDAGFFDGAVVQLYIADPANITTRGLMFTGSIQGVTYQRDGSGSFDIRGPSATNNKVVTQKFQPMCRTDLYSTLCGVDPDAYDVAAVVATIVSEYEFTITGGGAFADGYFNQGVAQTDTNFAFEIASWIQGTATITTYLKVGSLIEVGQDLILWPGCDKTMGAGGCPKFSNQLNYQGELHFLGAASVAAVYE